MLFEYELDAQIGAEHFRRYANYYLRFLCEEHIERRVFNCIRARGKKWGDMVDIHLDRELLADFLQPVKCITVFVFWLR